MQKIVALLQTIRPEVNYAAASDFFSEGLLDSFDLVTLVAELDRSYGISIDGTDIVPENFCNVTAIVTLLQKYGVTP